MPDLKLDLDTMDEAVTTLHGLRAEFASAVEFSRDLGSAAGHRRLAAVIGDFASAWNIRRAQISTDMQTVAEAAQSISATFREIDEALAKHIEGEVG